MQYKTQRTIFTSAILTLAMCAGAFAQEPASANKDLFKQLREARAGRRAESAVPGGENMKVAANISYGQDPLQKLDIYSPKDGKALPVVLFIHGGGWRVGDKGQTAHVNKGKAFTDDGFVLVSANYRLSPQVKHPGHVEDVASAFAWVHSHIKEYGGDPSRIFLMGHSAGAHLVLLLGTNDRFLAAHKLSPANISGVISLDTASLDLIDRTSANSPGANVAGELSSDMYENAFGHDPKVLTDASPTLNIRKGKKYPRMLLICGSRRRGAISQQEKFVRAFKTAGGTVTFQTVPLSHSAINQAAGNRDSEVFKAALDFLKGGSPESK